MCLISRDPRRVEYTICTAAAPDAVFTVRTYGTGPLYNPISVQIRPAIRENPQLSKPPAAQTANLVTSQVNVPVGPSGLTSTVRPPATSSVAT